MRGHALRGIRPGLHALLLAVAAMTLLAVFDSGTIDLAVSRLAFDPETHNFPMKHHWLFDDLLHFGLKSLAYILAAPALALCLSGVSGKLPWLPPRNALLAAGGMILIPLATAGLKAVTNRHCPWSIDEFGGFAPYVGLLYPAPADLARGVCFPAGHASAGFAWLAWVPALWLTRPRAARRILAGALFAGVAMGAARIMQGAHFASHVFWSAWLAWSVCIGLTALLRADVTGAGAAESILEFRGRQNA